MRARTSFVAGFLSLVATVGADSARAVVTALDPATTGVHLDSKPTVVDNSAKRTETAGYVTISASGDGRLGSNPGEVYNSLPIVYRDASDRLQYAAAPMNGCSAGITGNHYDYGFLTDAV